MKAASSVGTRSLAAIIMVPLVVVAALVAFNLTGRDALEKEASALAATLDKTLARSPENALTSIAVLPLSNQSAASDLEFLASGIADAVREQLSGIDGVRTIGVQSSVNVASQSLSVDSMARLLGVRYLLRGEVASGDDGPVFEIELVRSDGNVVWSETWQTPALATVSDSVSARVLQTVLPSASPQAAATDSTRLTGQAFTDFLRGKYLIDRHNADDVLEGLGYLNRAIAEEPVFEQAYWAKIAGHQRMTWIDAQATEEHEALINETIDAWLDLDVEAPLTYRMQSLRAANDQRPLTAYRAFQKALQLAPQQYAYDRGYMISLCGAGYVNRCLEQALGLARRDPVSAAAHAGLANVYLVLNERELMEEHARLTNRFGGDLGGFYEAQAMIDRNEWDAASERLQQGLTAVGVDASWVPAYIAAFEGTGDSRAAVEAMRATDDASALWLDQFYSELVDIGEIDLAFDAARVLIAEKYQTWHIYLWSDGRYPFRNDPRFIELMSAIGNIELWRELGPPDCCVGANPEPFCAQLN